ncbi:MAG: 4-hydroxy-tetrahydrodipicolinate synthase [Aureispira sp.]
MNHPFRGTGVALITPFKEQAVDYPALTRVVEHCITGGLDFLVALGTTAETATLSAEEQQQVLRHIVTINNGRVPIVAGYGGNNTAALVAQIKSANFDGVDGILSASPSYNKPTQEGIYQHFMAIEAVAPCPIILYNVPSRTASNMTAETTLRLANASNKFAAVKEASGNIPQIMQIINGAKPDHFAVLSGDDNGTLPLVSCGADGLISVVANAYPTAYSQLVKAARAGDMNRARSLHYDYMELVNALFIDGNPAGVKYVLEQMGICSSELRLPLVGVTNATKVLLEQLMQALPASSLT